MRNHPSLQRLIPITALRHLYQLLRDFPRGQFHLEVARELCRRPEQLAKLVAESREHFSLYDNRGEAFHDRGNQGVLNEDRQRSLKLADVFLCRVATAGTVAVADQARFGFGYVDYDISPRRTTGSEFENGKPSQNFGRGGIDVLLSNQMDQTPIVGEIKADTDVNPFLGLIQSLVYAVELSTPPQRARLNQFYRERFAKSSIGPGIDIYLFLLRYPQDAVSQEFLRLASQVSAYLVTHNPASSIIRRIVALETPMSLTDNLDSFTVAFAHGHQLDG